MNAVNCNNNPFSLRCQNGIFKHYYSTFANRPIGEEFWMPLRGRNHANLFKSIKFYLFDLFLFVRFLAVGDIKTSVLQMRNLNYYITNVL